MVDGHIGALCWIFRYLVVCADVKNILVNGSEQIWWRRMLVVLVDGGGGDGGCGDRERFTI